MSRYRAVRTSSGSLAMLAAIRRALADVRRGAAPISQKALAISREVTPLLQMRQGTDYTIV